MRRVALAAAINLAIAAPAWCAAGGGPPYINDDAEPTAAGTWEVNMFATGTMAAAGNGEQAGVNASYGLSKNLEFGATIAGGFVQAPGARDVAGFGDVQLGFKYQFIHQDMWGFEAALVPSVTVPTHGDPVLGHDGVVPTLSLQFQKNWGTDWTAFGGGGCTWTQDARSENFCLVGAALAWQIEPDLQIGVEAYHFTPVSRHGLPSTGLGFGVTYDLSQRWHLLASAGPGVQNAAATDSYTWYIALQFTR